MKRVESAGRSVLRLSWVLAFAAAVLVAALAVLYERQGRDEFRESARADVLGRLSLLCSELQGRLDANIQLIQGLVSVLGYEPGMDQERFARLGARLLAGKSEIRNIAAAPDLVVSLVYPLAGNEAVLGLDYREVPDQFNAARIARDLCATTLAGPVELVQGGSGFVIRAPVLLESDGHRSFWGIVSAVIEAEELYRATGQRERPHGTTRCRSPAGAPEAPAAGTGRCGT